MPKFSPTIRADGRGSDCPAPTKLWLVVVRTWQDEQALQRLVRTIGDARRWIAQLLKCRNKCRWIFGPFGIAAINSQIYVTLADSRWM